MVFAPITYDAEADVLYIRFSSERVARTICLDDLRMVDYSGDSGVVGIEFVDATGGIALAGIPFRDKVEQLIRESGHQFPVFA